MNVLEVVTNICYQFLGLLSSFTLSSAVDVLLVSFIIYQFIKLIRETRAEQLVKGILILLIVWSAANLFNLQMMKTILSYVFNFSVIALMIVFQPEVRRALEQIGRSGLRKGFGLVQKEEDMEKEKRRCIQAVSEAADNFQRSKTGALIVFERETKLGDIIDTGTVVNACLLYTSSSVNIFRLWRRLKERHEKVLPAPITIRRECKEPRPQRCASIWLVMAVAKEKSHPICAGVMAIM